MDLYIKLFLIFVLIIEILTIFTIGKAMFTSKKETRRVSNAQIISFVISSAFILFATLFALIYLV